MKLIHLSDLHIGKRVNEVSMIEDQEYILLQILQIIDEERADAVLIAGDVYDKSVPSAADDARCFGVTDGDYVTVDVEGKRRCRWFDVQVRVHPDFRLEMHVDTDDANAAGIGNGFKVKVVK